MAHLTSTLFVGSDDKAVTFDRPATNGRVIGLTIGDLSIQFRSFDDPEGEHAAIVALLHPLQELEAASAARLADRP